MKPEKVKPISPKEVAGEKIRQMPDAVLEAFNELIARGGSGYVTVMQKDVVALMVKKGLSRSEIFDNGWLDVEDIYRKAGWIVEYDKPGYNETYDAYFTFRPAGGRRRGSQ